MSKDSNGYVTMDIDPDAVGELFGDDRERDLSDVKLSHWLTIERDGHGYVIETDDEMYRIDEDEAETMLDDCGWDSIWCSIAERTKAIRWLQSNDDQ